MLRLQISSVAYTVKNRLYTVTTSSNAALQLFLALVYVHWRQCV